MEPIPDSHTHVNPAKLCVCVCVTLKECSGFNTYNTKRKLKREQAHSPNVEDKTHFHPLVSFEILLP